MLVIGAGIVGSRIAYEAAGAGLRVALVDAGDFGGATSSASSKLVHGGLRYLSTGQLGLVRAALAERRALERRVAPHLVTPLPLVVAVPERVSRRRVAFGARLYAALSGFRDPPGRLLRSDEARSLAPYLRGDLPQSCLLLHEATTHDGRLTLATVTAAARRGAIVANHTRVVALELVRERAAGAVLEGRPGEGLPRRLEHDALPPGCHAMPVGHRRHLRHGCQPISTWANSTSVADPISWAIVCLSSLA